MCKTHHNIDEEKTTKRVSVKKAEDWLGSDQLNTKNLVGLLVEIANGEYTPRQLKSDILNYKN